MAYQSKYTGLQIDDILDSVEWKQSKIEDLASIRAGAQKGATALQSYTEKYTGTVTGIKINGVVKSGSGVIDLGTITPTKISQLENDSNFVTPEDVAAVALSGSYNDLHDTPSIPAAVTESTVSGWGFTKNTGTYSKPSGGIPKSDLASAVQTSLGKADTAIQSTSFGELTDLAVVKGFESSQNGTVYALPDCDTGDEDDILLSRSSVKTINGQSIVGSGDITISGGSGGGEDIRYFTEFTVEQISAATMNTLEIDTSELLDAVQNNKLICIPYQDGVNGFIAASYKEESCIYFLDERVLYKLDLMPFAITINRIYLSHNTVYSNNADPWMEEVYDNSTYIESNPATGTLAIYISEDLLIGSTIRFTTGEDCSLQISGRGANNLLWANGVIPTIEPGVTYELSLRTDYTDTRRAYAVLAPFKLIE